MNMEVRAQLAQSLIVGCPGLEMDSFTGELIAAGVGGVILFAANYASPLQLWNLTNQLQEAARQAGRPGLFIMVDQEGGSVARLKAPFTHECDFSAFRQSAEEDMYAYGRRIGRELTGAGINWNLAPVVDVNLRPEGIMARRSLGHDPVKVGKLAGAYIKGLRAAGCMACAKHFPGLGRTDADTHKLAVSVDLSLKELARMELKPFRAAVAAGVDGVLVSHAVFRALDPDYPSSLSPLVIEGLLRGECAFERLVLSDDLSMGAVPLAPDLAAAAAYQAGTDLLLLCRGAAYAEAALDLLTEEYKKGRISQARLSAGSRRIGKAKAYLPGNTSYEDLMKILTEHS
jgi:beta-N-acetylhexosaminidase